MLLAPEPQFLGVYLDMRGRKRRRGRGRLGEGGQDGVRAASQQASQGGRVGLTAVTELGLHREGGKGRVTARRQKEQRLVTRIVVRVLPVLPHRLELRKGFKTRVRCVQVLIALGTQPPGARSSPSLPAPPAPSCFLC